MSTQRLFVAIELPERVKDELRSMQPDCPGLRPTKTDNLHLTMHFIGVADTQRIAAALAPIGSMAECFDITLTSVGTFSSRGRGLIVWTGIEPDARLSQLHFDLGVLLQSVDVAVDTRPFKPHITLARGERVRVSQVHDFLNEHREYQARVRVDAVYLMSSELQRGGSVYSVEERFPLLGNSQ